MAREAPTEGGADAHVKHPAKVLTEHTISKRVAQCQYGVRGEIFQRAQELVSQGRQVTFTSVGNPHQLGQPPLTFLRHVLSLCAAPSLIDDPRAAALFSADAIARARRYHEVLKGGLGAYQDSKGNGVICDEVCDFIARRDGALRPDPSDIFLTNGASDGVKLLLQTVIRGEGDGVLVPIPQYPLYSAGIALYGGKLIGYHLDEKAGWALSMHRIQQALDEAKASGITPRAIVFINPGNPTSQCLDRGQLQNLIQFAYTNRLLIMADEVYQDNIYGRLPFVSCYEVLSKMGAPYADHQELVSFHSVSKGAAGECGLRGAYFHLTNFDADVKANLYKVVSISLSPAVPGMVGLACYINPPQPGDESYSTHQRERKAIVDSLKHRARKLSDAFNALPGVSCQLVDGSMYVFPRIFLSQRAIAEAGRRGKTPDTFYCLELLEHAGIAATPGSSFEQEDGTYHFRTTILPPEDMIDGLVERFRAFHMHFTRAYGEPEVPIRPPGGTGVPLTPLAAAKL
uniref:Aminotransferase class I/classII large domain-containing protein n=1 Tax=Zooxanthella nutricula TaxID=1333877 RepID=A0A7S2IR88_9DINO